MVAPSASRPHFSVDIQATGVTGRKPSLCGRRHEYVNLQERR